MKKVNFICIGMGRSGSTWLYNVLLSQSGIELAKNIKETEFFNHNYHRGVKWYHSFYTFNENKVYGELSNRYFSSPIALQNIKTYNPDIKIILLLRNPFERAASVWNFLRREGSSCASVKEMLETNRDAVQSLKYMEHITRAEELFGDSLHIILHDDIKHEPEDVLKNLSVFLNSDLVFLQKFSNVINPGIVPRAKLFGVITKRMALLLRKLGAYKILSILKHSNFLKKILFRKAASSDNQLTTAERKLIGALSFEGVTYVEKKLGRSLHEWKL